MIEESTSLDPCLRIKTKRKYKPNDLMKHCSKVTIRTNSQKVNPKNTKDIYYAFCTHSFKCISQNNEVQASIATTASKITHLPINYLHNLVEICPFDEIVQFLLRSNDLKSQKYVLQIFDSLSRTEIFPINEIMEECFLNKLFDILGSYIQLHQLIFSFFNHCIKYNSDVLQLIDNYNVLKYINIESPCPEYLSFLYYYLINSNDEKLNFYVSTIMISMLPFGSVEVWKEYSDIIFSDNCTEIPGFSTDYNDVIIKQIEKCREIPILKICFRLIAYNTDDTMGIYKLLRKANEVIGSAEFLSFSLSFLDEIWPNLGLDDSCSILDDLFPIVINAPLKVQHFYTELLIKIPSARITRMEWIVLLLKFLPDRTISHDICEKLFEILSSDHIYKNETLELLSDIEADINELVIESDTSLSELANLILDFIT